MRKKIFIITIPMLPAESLKSVQYMKDDSNEIIPIFTKFPGIAMIKENISRNERVKIVTVRTNDDNSYTKGNYELFKNELSDLSAESGLAANIDCEIIIPHDEGLDKQQRFLKHICDCYENKADIYMDITYGTKATSIGMFSSLVYAEKAEECSIKKIVYGKFNYSSENGSLYNIKSLYDIAMLINSSAYMPKKNIKLLLDTLIDF